MRRLLPYMSTYLRDSQHVIDLVNNLGTLPPHARLFTADATAIYTNIEPDVGVQAIIYLIASLQDNLPPNFPSQLIVDSLRLVMTSNVFQIDNTFWWQHIGTAMGTPCACIYATTTYGYHEKTKILPRHTKNLALLGRFIDDMLGIWIGPDEEWPRFQQSLRGFGKLTWICSDRSSSVVFLDLTLSIAPSNTITSQTYQKPLNLYLYIPPTSSHPTSCFTGTIVGNILRFWRQNPDLSHYRRLVSDFATHLIDRGYTTPTVERAMLSAAAKIDSKANLPENNTPHPLHRRPQTPLSTLAL
jgi:hypothetical protein